MSTESASPVEQFKSYEQSQQLVVGGVALTIVGSVLPWATFLGASVLGVEGLGIVSLLAGAAVAVALYVEGWTEQVTLGAAGAGALTVLVAIAEYSALATFGLYVTAIGGIVTVAGAYLHYQELQ